jgi:hypothetical protein
MMGKTVEEVLGARKAKREAAKSKGSKLPRYLDAIVAVLNGGGLWVDVLDYLQSNGVRTMDGNPISRSYLIDWCTLHVPPHDAALGTPEDVLAGRLVKLGGAGKYARGVAAKRAAQAAGGGPRAAVAAVEARVPAAPVTAPAWDRTSVQAPARPGLRPTFVMSPERLEEQTAAMQKAQTQIKVPQRVSRKGSPVRLKPVFSNVPPAKPGPAAGAVGSPQWTAKWLARMREDDDSADLSRATGKS